MSEVSKEQQVDEVAAELYRLATLGAGRCFGIDIKKTEELAGEPTPPAQLCAMAMLGCESREEFAFVSACRKALEDQGTEA